MSELKIGIIGTDGGARSGHAVEILKLLSDKEREANAEIIYGEDEGSTKELYDMGLAKTVAKTPEELLEKADAVMILNRDGRKHFAYAKPFLEKGIPVFIDKPVSCSYEEAVMMQNMAKKSGSVLMGGSYMKYLPVIEDIKNQTDTFGEILSGYLSFPIFLNSEHGGIHFYSHHLIEEMLTLFGNEIREIDAKVIDGKLTATAYYDKFPVIMNYSVVYPEFYAGVFGREKSVMKKVSADTLDARQLDLFIKSAKTGCGTHDICEPVKISCALEKAIKDGGSILL